MTVIQLRLRGASTRVLLTGLLSRSRDSIGLSGFLGVAAGKQCRDANGRHKAPREFKEDSARPVRTSQLPLDRDTSIQDLHALFDFDELPLGRRAGVEWIEPVMRVEIVEPYHGIVDPVEDTGRDARLSAKHR